MFTGNRFVNSERWSNQIRKKWSKETSKTIWNSRVETSNDQDKIPRKPDWSKVLLRTCKKMGMLYRRAKMAREVDDGEADSQKHSA
jgi:hypothetical protein